MFWHAALEDVPKGPAIIVANEFFDALPVYQAVKTEHGWHERQIEIDSIGNLAFTIAPDPIPHFDMLLPPARARGTRTVDLRMARRNGGDGVGPADRR